LATDIAEKGAVTFSQEYREYFADLGTHLSSPPAAVRAEEDEEGRLRKSVQVSAALTRVLRAEPLDIVTERLTGPGFDLVIATNILPYFDDRQLALAASNISAMIVPGGVFLHNEARPILGELTTAAGLPFEQSRRTVIATITGAPPLGDSIFIHTKR
jgi:chemotaxis methyl-accepting protein methylase